MKNAIIFGTLGVIICFILMFSYKIGPFECIGLTISIIIIAAIWFTIASKIADKRHKEEAQLVFDTLPNFKADNYYLSTTSSMSIGFDNQRKIICFLDTENKAFIFNYDKIIQSEIVIDGHTISKHSTTGTIGRSIIGGVIAGGAGAIIGGATGSSKISENVYSIDLKVTINNTVNPVFRINFLNKEVIKGDMFFNSAYAKVEKWHGIITGLIKQMDIENNNKPIENLSVSDELKKLKELLDNDVLTQDEFDKQKTKLLS